MHEYKGWICTNNSKSTVNVYIWPDNRSLHRSRTGINKETARKAQVTSSDFTQQPNFEAFISRIYSGYTGNALNQPLPQLSDLNEKNDRGAAIAKSERIHKFGAREKRKMAY